MIERILQLLKANSMTAKQLTELLGINKGSVTDWKSGKTKPSIEHIVGISQIFKVSTDYILTGKDFENFKEGLTINAQDIINDKLTPDERSLINTYRDLSDNGKTKMLDIAKEIWAEHKQPKSKFSNSLDKIVG